MSERATENIGAMVPGHYGTDAIGVTLSAATIAAAWNLQGDPAQPSFTTGVARLFGVPPPLVPNTTKRGNELIAFWIGPRSWLLVECSPVPIALTDFAAKCDAVNALGGALFDVSASRVAYRVGGNYAATVLAKSCPLDFHRDAFPAGSCAQSLLGHVNVIIERPSPTTAFTVMVARSFARDAWHGLCLSSAQYGYDVVPPVAYR